MRLFYLLFLLFPLVLSAQQQGWQQLTISDGLSQGMIFDLKQDQKGFIWVATKDGLNRYDGHNFTVFTHDPYNDYSISDNNCSALLIDRQGRLWVGTLNQGLNLFDDRTQRFYHIDINDRDSPNAGNYEIRLLTEDPEGNIWVGTSQNKLFKLRLPDTLKTGFPSQANSTSQVQFSRFSFPIPGANSSSAPGHVVFRPGGRAIASVAGGMYTLNWRHPAGATPFHPFGPQASPFLATAQHTRPDYWFGYRPGALTGWRQGKAKIIPLPPLNTATVYVAALDSNTVAVATPAFLWVMSPEQLYAQDSLSASNAFARMPPNLYGVTRLLKDARGTIWVGTAGYGLRTFNPTIRQFKTYLPNTSLTFLFQDRQGQTYVRDQFRYGRLDRVANRLLPFLDRNSQSDSLVQSYLMQDRRGFFWLSSANLDAHQYRLVKLSENRQPLQTYALPPGTAFGVYGNQTREDAAGHLWLGAANGKLLRFDPLTETFKVYSYQHLLPQQGADIETYALYFDQAGTLWIGTQKGLIRADHPLTNPAFTLYKNSVKDRHSLSNDFVSCVVDDPDEPARYLWVSTKGGGLERLDKQARNTGTSAGDPVFRHFTEAQGLPNKVVYGILVDAFKNLWLSTNRGLAQFNPRTGRFRHYTRADGLQDDEFNTGSFLKTASGELLFGGVNGLNSFRTSDVINRSGPAPLAHIVGLKVNNEPVTVGSPDGILTQRIDQTPQIDLSYRQNLVTLEFAVMDYTNPAQNRYRYRLDGIDQDWVEAGTNRFANYAQLPYGSYTLTMMGSSDGETWSKPVEIRIRVHPPFYRTWWAYLFYTGVLAVIGWLLYRFQKQRLILRQQIRFEQKEASRLLELDALKTQFFTNISHEFRTPLTLILGPIEQAVQDYAHDARFPLIQRNANRLLSLINQLLDLSKLEAGQLRPEPERGDMAVFFRTLASSFESLALSRRIQFRFTQNRSNCLADFDRDKMEKIITNLLSNAFKFTPAEEAVHMTVQFPEAGLPATVQVTIGDTGIGIPPDELPRIFERFYQWYPGTRSADAGEGRTNRPYEGTGIGLALVHELVRVLGGTIHVASTEGVGTTFTVTLPVSVDTSDLAVEVNGSSAVEGNPPASLLLADPAGQGNELAVSAEEEGAVLLIIDDNADIRTYVRSVFEADYQIIEAEDGQDGLERATTTLPDIVICDLMMPRLDGFGFCRALKTQESTSHIPVVMLTAKATAEDRIEGFELGADDYLTKPFSRAELQARVRNLVQQRERLYQQFAARPVPVATNHTPVVGEAEPVKPALLAAEQKFLDRLTALVLNQLDNADFSVETLAETINMSRTQLHRKLKAIANITATNFIRDIRLRKAADLLAAGEGNVSQVAFAVGFDSLSYFAKVFQERYGVLPSQYGRTQPDRAG